MPYAGPSRSSLITQKRTTTWATRSRARDCRARLPSPAAARSRSGQTTRRRTATLATRSRTRDCSTRRWQPTSRPFHLRPGYAKAHSNLVYALHFHPDYDAPAIAEAHRQWDRQHARPLAPSIRPHANDRSPERRLRIGYVSPDLREHPVGRFLLPLLQAHDPAQFEVFCYADVPAPTP